MNLWRARAFRVALGIAAAAPGGALAGQAGPGDGWPGGPEPAAAALRSGRYAEAEAAYRAALPDSGARGGLAETLRLVGRYREALAALEAGEESPGPELLARARIHLEIGETAAARRLLEEAASLVPGGDGLRIEAESELGLLELRLGERSRGLTRLDGVIRAYDEAFPGTLDARAVAAVGRAAARLGFRSPGLFRDALRVFDEAAALDPADPLPRLLAGELLVEKFNRAEAAESLGSVLATNPRHPRALTALARSGGRRGGPAGAPPEDPLAAALAANPNHPPARALRVRRALERERLGEAGRLALEAAADLPASPEVRAALGAVFFVAGEDEALAEVEARFRADWPGDPRLELGLAAAAERQRRYREAARHARAALEIEPESGAGRLLGLNLLRLGEMEEGRETLEAAFARDPFDALLKNNLDLLDELDGFTVRHSPPFEFVLPTAESGILAPYLEAVSREALESFRERYHFEPPARLRIEIYDRSADFSVRTVGITGIGAHGVCFGHVVALESPSAREIGAYHWASTLWHELAHVATMGLTGNRIPRWFTEGLSLFEERRRFGEGIGLAFFAALADGRLLEVADLNDGFVRPAWPGQVAVSYVHASLVVEHIEAEYGFGAILAMLDGFRRGRTSAEVIRETLGVSAGELDAAVDAMLERRYGPAARGLAASALAAPGEGRGARPGGTPDELLARAAAAPENFLAQLRAGIALAGAGRDEEAKARLERAAGIAPEYGGADGPHRYLAEIFTRADQPDEAARALARHLENRPAAYDAWLRLAEIQGAAGDEAAAAASLTAAIEAYPMLAEPHERLAEAAYRLGRPAVELRERRAVLATAPSDRAGALHALALAHLRAGDPEAARRRVIEALEIAPTWEEALRLLLELRRQGPGSGER